MESTRYRTAKYPSLDSSLRGLGTAVNGLFKESLTGTSNLLGRMGDVLDAARAMGPKTRQSTQKVPCCPPEWECPPQCLLEITRRAQPGEVILVPFRIHNGSSVPKHYAVGVRPMVGPDQTPAPSQPTLDKTSVNINPLQSVLLEMRIDLSSGYRMGSQYEATIVVREKDINQNICFRLILQAEPVPVATPYDEKDLKCHFVGWQQYFYCCEPDSKGRQDIPPPPPIDPTGQVDVPPGIAVPRG